MTRAPVVVAAAVSLVGIAAWQTPGADTRVVPVAGEIVPIEATVVSLSGTTSLISGERTIVRLAADVLFEFDSAELRPPAERYLRRDLVPFLEDAGVEAVTVIGHTDSQGSTSYNQQLSEDRANAVAGLLRTALPGLAIDAEGRGETEPVAPNETADGEDNPRGRAQNRRVEILFEAPEADLVLPSGLEPRPSATTGASP